MSKIIICVGISGSGKSAWATNYIKENSNTLRINRDDIRRTLVGNLNNYYERKDLNNIEKRVTFIEQKLFSNLIFNSFSVIVDNTNLKFNYFKDYIFNNPISNNPINTYFKFFDIDLMEAKKNVLKRDIIDPLHIEIYDDIERYLKRYNNQISYIDKQYHQYQFIKKYIETNYKNNII